MITMKETGKKICPLLSELYGKTSPCALEMCAWYCNGDGGYPPRENGCALLLAAQAIQSMDKNGIYVEITND